MATATFTYHDPFPLGPDETPYRLLTPEGVSIGAFEGAEILRVDPAALTRLARDAFRECSFFLRPAHNEQVAAILDDAGASANDRGVALAMLRNAVVAARGELPICQDTGTATIVAKKGQRVWTGVRDEAYLAQGVWETYQRENLRYSQTSALTLYDEANTGDNLPAQIDIYATPGMAYDFLFVAKGGGSANKSMLWQETRALLEPAKLEQYLVERMRTLGTAACPPYHIAIVIGGTSAEACLKTVKLASAKYYDALPTEGGAVRPGVPRPRAGGEARGGGPRPRHRRPVRRHGVRPRRAGHPAPAPRRVAADRDRRLVLGRPQRPRPDRSRRTLARGARPRPRAAHPGRDANRRATSTVCGSTSTVRWLRSWRSFPSTPSRRRCSSPARWSWRATSRTRSSSSASTRAWAFRDYLLHHPVYYAGPAKTPPGKPSGSFGPTTAGRMDSYVDLLQSHGASLVMIAKGNRSRAVTEACQRHGGFYLGSIGGPAAILADDNIRRVECIDYPELGMEAVWKIDVVDFPAFILVDDKGNDFFRQLGVG